MWTITFPGSGVEAMWPVLILLGLIAGIHSGFFGIGGGWVIMPALNFLGLPVTYAVGTSLAYIFGTGLISVWKHRRRGNLALTVGLTIGLCMLVWVQLGKILVLHLEQGGAAETAVRWLYVMFLLFVSGTMIRDFLGRSATSTTEADHGLFHRLTLRLPVEPRIFFKTATLTGSVSVWPLVLIAVLAGLLSGILGVGGGVIIVPVLVYGCGLPTVVAVGTSLICIIIATPFGMVSYALSHRVDFVAAGIMVAGAVIGAPLGVWATDWVKAHYLRMLYGCIMLCGAVSVLLKIAGCNTAATWLIFSSAGGIALGVVGLALWHAQKHRRQAGMGKG